jgi:Ran GTPase-activating protein (RanGAP) involved in mRNA processing and transport
MPLESLDLSGNCFTATGCEALFKGHGLERLKVLHLSFNALEGLRSDHLSTLFRKSPRLHELGLESCGLSASIIVAALRMKAAGTTLALSLSNNPLLIEALELQHLCEKTASLDISNSTFDSGLLGQSSAAGAAAALARGSNVGSNGGAVLMSGTKCSVGVAKQLSVVVQTCRLRKIDLSFCGLDVDALGLLVTAAVGSVALATLSLSGNPFKTPDSLSLLNTLVKGATTLEELDLYVTRLLSHMRSIATESLHLQRSGEMINHVG